jgi:hypothetical protein
VIFYIGVKFGGGNPGNQGVNVSVDIVYIHEISQVKLNKKTGNEFLPS